MNLVRHRQPWSLLGELESALDRALQVAGTEEGDQSNVVTSRWAPAVDIQEEPERFVLHADIPGVEPKDIEVTMDSGMLTIKGERSLEERKEGEGYSRVERAHGLFYRRFTLPESADPEGIKARGDKGVLTVEIPKRPVAQARRIEVLH